MIYKGEKGLLQKAKEKISRKIRGKEKTNVKGIEQDTKTGALTHNAPKDRMDTKPGRIYKSKIKTLLFGQKPPKPPKSNDMSYAERKKEIAAEKKEAKRKADFDKKYVTKKAAGGRVGLKKGTPKPKKTFRQEEQKGMALDRVMSRPYNPKDTFKDYVNRTRAMGGNVRTAAEMEKSISAAKSAKKSDKRVRKANGGRTNYRGGGLATSGYGKVMKS